MKHKIISFFKSGKKIHLELDFTRRWAVVVTACVLAIGFILSYAVIAHTPLRNFIPGYPDAKVRRAMVENEMKADSLEKCIYRWELYTANLRTILQGGIPERMDSLKSRAARDFNSSDKAYLSKMDSVLRDIVRQEQKGAAQAEFRKIVGSDGPQFFRPVDGAVTEQFVLGSHPWIEISASAGSTVCAVLDGTIIYSGWSEDDKWCVIVRHGESLISVTKNLDALLKKSGSDISAGTAVALSSADSPVCFELWRDDAPVDPLKYIRY